MIATTLKRLVWYLFVAFGLMVFFYIPWNNSQMPLPLVISMGLISCTTIVLIARSFHTSILEGINHQEKQDRNLAIFFVLTIGVILRIGWVYIVPAVQQSDFLNYWNAAKRLSETGIYSFKFGPHVWYAWLPPGYPFFLAGWFVVIGERAWIPAFTNICFYILTSLTVWSITKQIGGKKAGLLATVFLTLWLSQIALTGLAATEHLSMLLLISGMWAFMKSCKYGQRYAVIAGALTGFGALVRPTFLVLPLAWILFISMNQGPRRLIAERIAVAMISMFLMIVPWSIRNYIVLGKLISISTNGGSVFYRANNPLASGGFTRHGAKDLNAYLGTEVTHNRIGYSWGVEWIRENPLDFLRLVVKKQGILLGEDTTGVYWAVERGHRNTGVIYQGLKAASNLWWIGIWTFAVIGAIRCHSFFTNNAIGSILLSVILYFIIIHSVFESQPRYHMPFVPLVVVISALAIYPPKAPLLKIAHEQ